MVRNTNVLMLLAGPIPEHNIQHPHYIKPNFFKYINKIGVNIPHVKVGDANYLQATVESKKFECLWIFCLLIKIQSSSATKIHIVHMIC